jgi:L-histidine N-alpha-methyltransferase
MLETTVETLVRTAAEDDGDSYRALRGEVLAGLSEAQKALPARWLYDLRGSQLFEQITRLPEYYLTRVETALLAAHGADIAELTGQGRAVVEFGSGSSGKTPLVLRATGASRYVPIDISGTFLERATRSLAEQFPDLPVMPIVGDFTAPIALPDSIGRQPVLGFFPGSTIGNFTPSAAIDLLRSMREMLGPGSQLLIGFDRIKDVATLIAAYDDAQGVTAEFNLNLLRRLSRELQARIPVERFDHLARWNREWNRIEMHLVAQSELAFEVCGRQFSMAAGETIHTENSHKYTPGEARLLLQASGWSVLRSWTDEGEAFLVILAEASPLRSAP